MIPTLLVGDYIMVNKFAYAPASRRPFLERAEKAILPIRELQRGDIVVFKFPEEPEKDYIKRVIGLPGEKVRIANGRVFINGRELNEPYVKPAYLDYQSYPERAVEPDHFYVLGDHRNSSNDSREWWTVPREYIYGKAVLVYWPVEKFQLLR